GASLALLVVRSARDDVVVGLSGSVRTYVNVETPGYLSLPSDVSDVSGFLTGAPKYAAGDFNADGVADLVAVNSTSLQRYEATSPGSYTALTAVTASPGPGGGVPVVAGRTVAVANSRLRLYDDRCTAAPAGFPGDETF